MKMWRLASAGLVMMSSLALTVMGGNVKQLSKANLNKARQFIMTQGRPLEQALYRLRFEGGSADAVRAALQDYQNQDGGFGKALEPDLRAPESSVLATARAFQTLTAVKTPPDHRMVKRALAYLTFTFDETKGVWRIIPLTAAKYPHAPWWNQEQLEQVFGGFQVLPRAEVLGYILLFDPPSFPVDRRLATLKAVSESLEGLPDTQASLAADSCARLYETGRVPAEFADRIYQKLAQLVPRAVEQDPGKWKQYCLKPLWLVRTPESPFRPLIASAVEHNLDYEIDNQSDDGSWVPNWTWYGAFPETWPAAEKEWRSVLTMQTLEALQAFGRIER